MTPLSRAIVGSRRSYGTLPNTTPCQVRRCFGKRSSRTTLAISSPKPITRIRSIATFLVLCSLFINVFLLQRPQSLPHFASTPDVTDPALAETMALDQEV